MAIGDERGQMTVELCVVFPVVIAIAVIATNALTFFGYCAEFDRVARNAARTFACSTAQSETLGQVSDHIRSAVESELDASNLECDVRVQGRWDGLEHVTATLSFRPTLFGLGLRDEIFGVQLPMLTHETTLTLEPYKPGMLF